jgi:hypothetical protein
MAAPRLAAHHTDADGPDGRHPAEVAEHCLARALPTIQGTCNRYGYLREKREAFDKLAELIGRITTPADNVMNLPRAPLAAV